MWYSPCDAPWPTKFSFMTKVFFFQFSFMTKVFFFHGAFFRPETDFFLRKVCLHAKVAHIGGNRYFEARLSHRLSLVLFSFAAKWLTLAGIDISRPPSEFESSSALQEKQSFIIFRMTVCRREVLFSFLFSLQEKQSFII